ncbi:MAG: hypothetical protein J6Y91_06055 [Alphaproteobacteria bacterium]|nr:hypothetical protein [Alphaproteobacteria bacterium]
MKRLVIVLLAVITVIIASVEYLTIGLPSFGDFVLTLFSLYLPAGIVLFVIISFIFLRCKTKEVLWALCAGAVAAACSFVCSHAIAFIGPYVNADAISDDMLLISLFLMVIYLLSVPALSLSAYFYSISDTTKRIYH